MEPMDDVEFVIDAGVATGYGRIIYKGRYFGLPMELVEYLKALHDVNRMTELAKLTNSMP